MRAIPAFLKTRFNTNEILTSLMLVYVAQLFLDWLARGVFRDPNGNNFPGSIRFPPAARVPEIYTPQGDAHWGVVIAAGRRRPRLADDVAHAEGFRGQGARRQPARRSLCRLQLRKMVFFAFLLSGALAGLAGIIEVAGPTGQLREVVSPGYGFAAIIVAFLGRLNPLGIIAAGLPPRAHLSRRRGGADRARRFRQGGARVPGHAAVLRARLRHADPLPGALHGLRRPGEGATDWACSKASFSPSRRPPRRS